MYVQKSSMILGNRRTKIESKAGQIDIHIHNDKTIYFIHTSKYMHIW